MAFKKRADRSNSLPMRVSLSGGIYKPPQGGFFLLNSLKTWHEGDGNLFSDHMTLVALDRDLKVSSLIAGLGDGYVEAAGLFLSHWTGVAIFAENHCFLSGLNPVSDGCLHDRLSESGTRAEKNTWKHNCGAGNRA